MPTVRSDRMGTFHKQEMEEGFILLSLDGASEAKFLYDIFHGTFLLSHHTIHH